MSLEKRHARRREGADGERGKKSRVGGRNSLSRKRETERERKKISGNATETEGTNTRLICFLSL